MQTIQQLQSGELKGSIQIQLSCGLSKFPTELFDLVDTLEILDLSSNELTELPSDFGRFKKLKIAFFSDNKFTVLPKVLADCPSLTMIGFRSNQIVVFPENSIPLQTQWLVLTNNQIEILPKSLGECLYLQKVAFAGNKIKELPVEMENCKRLELLRISANQLETLPEWLLNLPRISWLAFSGNPCSQIPQNNLELIEMEWNELEIQEQLGEGASGIISKAIWNSTSIKEVAVKIFKGEVTSDGFPEDELTNCIAAGFHSNLVPLIAEIKNHSEGKMGIVMELISSDYTNLGNPPSFETCTRDVFPESVRFTFSQVVSISKCISSAMEHLHNQGILHGDLYAHNTMTNPDGRALLGDFGAATRYDRNTIFSKLLEKLDVRAFGCLLEDLLIRIEVADLKVVKYDLLNNLKDSCLDPLSIKRPDFKKINLILNALTTNT